MLLWFYSVYCFSLHFQFTKMLLYHCPFTHSPMQIHANMIFFFTIQFSNMILFCLIVFVWFHARLFVYNRVPCFTLILSDETNNGTLYTVRRTHKQKIWNKTDWTENTRMKKKFELVWAHSRGYTIFIVDEFWIRQNVHPTHNVMDNEQHDFPTSVNSFENRDITTIISVSFFIVVHFMHANKSVRDSFVLKANQPPPVGTHTHISNQYIRHRFRTGIIICNEKCVHWTISSTPVSLYSPTLFPLPQCLLIA